MLPEKLRIKPLSEDPRRSKKPLYFIAAFLIVLILGGAGILYYQTYLRPFRQVVLTVDNQVIRMNYFLKRIRMADNNPTLTLQQLSYEQMVRILAPQYGIVVSPSDIDAELRREAAGSAAVLLSDADFYEWYNNRITAVKLSDSEYRAIVESNLLATRLLEYLAKDIPPSAEQVHLYTIVTATSDDAVAAMKRINDGENFSAIAEEISLDTQTKSKGGEVGWIPRGVTPYDEVIFKLDTGQAIGPVAIDPSSSSTGQYIIFMVAEKDPDRVIDANLMEVLRSRALYSLILQQIPNHVKYSYTPEDNAWVIQQLNH